jgi:hypothetical protein
MAPHKSFTVLGGVDGLGLACKAGALRAVLPGCSRLAPFSVDTANENRVPELHEEEPKIHHDRINDIVSVVGHHGSSTAYEEKPASPFECWWNRVRDSSVSFNHVVHAACAKPCASQCFQYNQTRKQARFGSIVQWW